MIILRIKYKKEHNMKFLSHLELIKTMERAFRRMQLPMKFSQGFNPKPKISYAAPLPVGVESECDFLDVELTEKIDVDILLKTQKEFLPRGLEFINAKYFGKSDSLMSMVTDSAYIIELTAEEIYEKATIQEKLDTFLELEEIVYEKLNKKKKLKQIDIKPLIQDFKLLMINDHQIILKALVTTGSNGNLKPEKLVALFADHASLKMVEGKDRYRRVELYSRNKLNTLVTLYEV